MSGLAWIATAGVAKLDARRVRCETEQKSRPVKTGAEPPHSSFAAAGVFWGPAHLMWRPLGFVYSDVGIYPSEIDNG